MPDPSLFDAALVVPLTSPSTEPRGHRHADCRQQGRAARHSGADRPSSEADAGPSCPGPWPVERAYGLAGHRPPPELGTPYRPAHASPPTAGRPAAGRTGPPTGSTELRTRRAGSGRGAVAPARTPRTRPGRPHPEAAWCWRTPPLPHGRHQLGVDLAGQQRPFLDPPARERGQAAHPFQQAPPAGAASNASDSPSRCLPRRSGGNGRRYGPRVPAARHWSPARLLLLPPRGHDAVIVASGTCAGMRISRRR